MSRWPGPRGLAHTDLAALYRNLAEWSLPGKALLGCGVACLIAVWGHAFYLSDAREQLRRQQAQEGVLVGQVGLKTVKAANLGAATQQLEATRLAFAQLLRQLPIDMEVPGLLEDITRLGSANGLTFDAIKWLDEQPRPLYVELPLHIAVTGRYHDLAGFIRGLGGLSRTVTVHDLSLGVTGPLLRLDLLAKTYRYTPSSDEDLRALATDEVRPVPGLAYAPAALRDPFQPPSRQAARPVGRPAAAPDPARPRGVLEGFAVEQFRMVGTLSQGTRVFALLRGTTGVHRLAIGDYLGPDHGRVTAIDDGHIELAELFPDGEGAWLERSRTLALNVNS